MDDKKRPEDKDEPKVFDLVEMVNSSGKDDNKSVAGGSSGGISLDFSDPLEEVYNILLKEGTMAMGQMLFHPVLGEIEDLAIRVKILVRHGQVERLRDAGKVKFRAIGKLKEENQNDK